MRAALLFDGNWRRAHVIANQNKSGSVKPTPVPDYVPQNAPTRDPNAIDIDTIKHLSPEERLDHIKKRVMFHLPQTWAFVFYTQERRIFNNTSKLPMKNCIPENLCHHRQIR
jgi:hypothetical protein